MNDSINTFIQMERRSVWIDATTIPHRLAKTHGQSWDSSDRIWVRVKAKVDEKTGEVIRAAYTDIGWYVWPKIAAAFHPKDDCDNPAVSVEWADGEGYFVVNHQRVDVSHWLPLDEPIPPGEVIPHVETGTVNQYSNTLQL